MFIYTTIRPLGMQKTQIQKIVKTGDSMALERLENALYHQMQAQTRKGQDMAAWHTAKQIGRVKNIRAGITLARMYGAEGGL